MGLPVNGLITQRNAQAYKYARENASEKVKILGSGSVFNIVAFQYFNATKVLWVKSGAGHWYKFDNALFKLSGRNVLLSHNGSYKGWVYYGGTLIPIPGGKTLDPQLFRVYSA